MHSLTLSSAFPFPFENVFGRTLPNNFSLALLQLLFQLTYTPAWKAVFLLKVFQAKLYIVEAS